MNRNNFFNRSPNASHIVSNMDSGEINIYKRNPSDGLDFHSTLPGHSSGFNDFDWYPWMSSSIEGSELLLVSSKDLPIQLWNCSQPGLICSWTAKDHLDQVANCLSVSFSPDAQNIIAGGLNNLWLFDVNRPGYSDSSRKATISRKSSNLGQHGLISCLNFRNDDSKVFAAGSFKGTTGIYDVRTLSDISSACGIFKAHLNGVSQIKFLDDGWSIISSGRRDAKLKKWDLRMFQYSDLQSDPVSEYVLPYQTNTNQRIYFDINCDQIYSGSLNDLVSFDLNTGQREIISVFENRLSSVSCFENLIAVSLGSRIYKTNSFKHEIDSSSEDEPFIAGDNCICLLADSR